ncbi:MAG: tetraacyldisaccharide 4'-kinase, partial [Chlorobi bacterium]|nr:tetraacyldisaccharide 4'-kinase [Chlorobiota bacterium]
DVYKRQVPIPVISVGNITTGGTSKTPMVIALAEMLDAWGLRVAIVSRGYKRRRGTAVQVVSDGRGYRAPVEVSGDEPSLLAERLPRAVVIVAKRRYNGAVLAHKQFGADVILLDDGFQHRSLYRQIDVVMVDRATLDRYNALLPAGTLREPLASLRRAHVLCAIGVDRSHVNARAACGTVVIGARSRISQWRTLDGEQSEPPSGSVVVVCAVARPERFPQMLEEEFTDLHVVQFLSWRDHHWFTEQDVRRIITVAQPVRRIVTTEKDAVKLSRFAEQFKQNGCVVYIACLSLEIPNAEHRMLESLLWNLRNTR